MVMEWGMMRHRMRVLRVVLLLAIGGVLLGGRAEGVPVTVAAGSSVPLDHASTAAITLLASYSPITWEGRFLSLLEAGGQVHLTSALAIGGRYRDSTGHGRSRTTTYAGTGWDAWAHYRVFAEKGIRPEIALTVQTVHDDIEAHAETATASAVANPNVDSTGFYLTAGEQVGTGYWQEDAGAFGVDVFGDRQATVLTLGMTYTQAFAHQLQGQVAAAGYRDNYSGTRNTYLVSGSLILGNPDVTYLALTGNLYPRGIPLAGTPFSPAAMAGTYYLDTASSMINTSSVGYVTLTGAAVF